MTTPKEQTQDDTPKQIFQDKFGDDGNCMSACLASLLGFELSEVPNFFEMGRNDTEWWNALRNWLAKCNVGLINTAMNKGQIARIKGYFIVGGISAREIPHVVLYKDGKPWFDPHPEQNGLSYIEGIDLIYPLNPLLPMGRRALTGSSDARDAAWPLKARVWHRESTNEWILEIEGTINDTNMTVRHTQPMTVKIEDVPGLPTMYSIPPTDAEADKG